MHQTVSLLDSNWTDAMDCLAERYAECRSGCASLAEKRAQGDYLGGLGRLLQSRPAMMALLGGGVGAGLGGASALIGGANKPEEERPSMWRSLLTGGLAGAAVGGGLGAAKEYWNRVGQRGGGDAAQVGTFKDPTSGQMQRIDPKLLRTNPELADEVRRLTEPAPWPERVAAGAGGFLWDVSGNAPVTLRGGLPALGMLDYLTHSEKWKLGDRLGFGYLSPQFSRDPAHLRAGLSELSAKEHAPNKELMQRILRNEGGELNRLAKGDRGYGGGVDVKTPVEQKVKSLTDPDAYVLTRGTQSEPLLQDLTREQLRYAKETGVNKFYSDLKYKETPRLFKGVFGQRKFNPLPVRIGARAGIYGMLPFAEYALNAQLRDRGKSEALQRLIEQYQQEGSIRSVNKPGTMP